MGFFALMFAVMFCAAAYTSIAQPFRRKSEYEQSQIDAIHNIDRKLVLEKYGPLVRLTPILQWAVSLPIFLWLAFIQGGGPDWTQWGDVLVGIGAAAFLVVIPHGMTGYIYKEILARLNKQTPKNQGE